MLIITSVHKNLKFKSLQVKNNFSLFRLKKINLIKENRQYIFAT